MVAAGVGIVLLVNPNLFVQDCVLVFLLLPALWPLRVRDYWRISIGVSALAAVVLLDQWPGTHLFTIVLAAVVVGVCVPTITSKRGSHRWALAAP
jgi:predicted branched-subunit amino acid permease